jgi:hypothetical protein
MTTDKIILNRNDLAKIQQLLAKFPETDFFSLVQESGSGIGSVLTMSFDYSVDDIKGTFTTEINGVEDW